MTPPTLEELLESAKALWPKRSDHNPRTMREDAMLHVVCALIENQTRVIMETIRENQEGAENED